MSIDNPVFSETFGKAKAIDAFVGKYVVIRSSEAIMAGTVVAADDTGIILENARRLRCFAPARKDEAWLEGAARCGVGEGSELSAKVPLVAISSPHVMFLCSEKAQKIIENYPTYSPHAE